MAYRYSDRKQTQLLPPSIEEYVAAGDPVRAYDTFVESLNLDELGIIEDKHKARILCLEIGNSEYHPKAMLKLLVYGYSYGFRSSRKLEKATYHNLSFIRLMGGSYECIRIASLFYTVKLPRECVSSSVKYVLPTAGCRKSERAYLKRPGSHFRVCPSISLCE